MGGGLGPGNREFFEPCEMTSCVAVGLSNIVGVSFNPGWCRFYLTGLVLVFFTAGVGYLTWLVLDIILACVGLSNMIGVRYYPGWSVYPTWFFFVMAGLGLHYLPELVLVYIMAGVGLSNIVGVRYYHELVRVYLTLVGVGFNPLWCRFIQHG